MKKRTPDPEWFAHLREGDVLASRTGTLRVVRRVTRWGGTLKGVTLAIRRASWTDRCYTVYTASDLKVFGFRYVGARVRLTTPLDVMIHIAIGSDQHLLRAADVRGVA